MAKNKECIVCGNKYEYCGHCSSNKAANSWRLSYCSTNCRDIFDTCISYVRKEISIQEANNIFSNLNTNIKIGKNLKNSFAEIKNYQPPKVDVDTEEKPKPRRRRRKKAEITE